MDKKTLALKYISYLENPINLIQDCFQTFDSTQGKYVPFNLFPKQSELLNIYHTKQHVLVNKSRQAGISTVTASYIAALCALATKDNPHKIIIVANKGNQAQDFLLKIKEFLSQVPRWVWGNYYDDSKEVDGHIVGKGSVKSVRLQNGCTVTAVATSKDAVRGASSPRIIVIDEAAHIDKTDGELMYGSAMMALSSNPSGQMFLISTPKGTDPIFFKTYSETISSNGDNKFTVHEMYYFQDPRYNKNLIWKYKHLDGTVEVFEETEFDNKKMEERFLKGWMPESDWYKEQCSILHNDKRLINQEVLCKFDGSGNNVLDFEHIIRQEENNIMEPIEKVEEKGNMWVWKYPEEGHSYCAFADVASGSGDDYSALQIIDIGTGEQVAEYKGKIKAEAFAPIVKNWCEAYNALTDVDTTGGYGDNLITDLLRSDFKLLKKDEKGEAKGFKFSGISRPKVIQRFVNYVETDSLKIRSVRLLSELKTYVWINGRPDHLRGFNDDCITATAGALWLFENEFKQVESAKESAKSMLNAWLYDTAPRSKEPNKFSQPNPNNNRNFYQNGQDMSDFLWLLK